MVFVKLPCRLLVAKSSTSHAQLDSAPCQPSKCVPNERIFLRFSPPCGHGFAAGRGDRTGIPHALSTRPKHSIPANLRFMGQNRRKSLRCINFEIWTPKNVSALESRERGGIRGACVPCQRRSSCEVWIGRPAETPRSSTEQLTMEPWSTRRSCRLSAVGSRLSAIGCQLSGLTPHASPLKPHASRLKPPFTLTKCPPRFPTCSPQSATPCGPSCYEATSDVFMKSY